jgi:signal transduction histidine kinase
VSVRLRRGLIGGIFVMSAYLAAVPFFHPAYRPVTVRGELTGAAVGLSFLVTGLIAWQRRPANKTGLLLTVTGYAWFAETLSYIPSAAAFTAGELVLSGIYLPALAHLALAFPSGQLHTRLDRWCISSLYVLNIGFGAALSITGEPGIHAAFPGSPDLLLIRSLSPLSYRTGQIGGILYVTAASLVIVAAAVRWTAMRGVSRHVVAPVLWASVPIGLSVVLSGIAPLSGVVPDHAVRLGGYLTLLLLPVGFLAGLLRVRLACGAVGLRVLALGLAPDPALVQRELSRAVGDPTLQIASRAASVADAQGSAPWAAELGGTAGRAVTAIGDDGAAVLLHDPALSGEPELLTATVAAAALATGHERLLAAGRRQAHEAGDAERRRLERNLHDGAQQRLIMLVIALRQAASQAAAGDPGLGADLAVAEAHAQSAIRELRDLSQGLYPAALTQGGVAGAIQDLAERSAIPVRILAVPAGRLPAATETTAYFVACEALANAAKHARARMVTIAARRAGGVLIIEVCDDGAGGAALSAGTGLSGLADRVSAAGGRLVVDSSPGAGTRVTAELPLPEDGW